MAEKQQVEAAAVRIIKEWKEQPETRAEFQGNFLDFAYYMEHELNVQIFQREEG